jgi:CheY-like chemotaxis protein
MRRRYNLDIGFPQGPLPVDYGEMVKANVLIAEDDPTLREIYIRKFRRAGYEIRTAENGEVAAQMIRTQPPDILICDIVMPVRDGWWVLEQFPKDTRAFPVIMLTNLVEDDTRLRCDTLADGYFVKKDMTLLTLLQMVAALLAKRPAA